MVILLRLLRGSLQHLTTQIKRWHLPTLFILCASTSHLTLAESIEVKNEGITLALEFSEQAKHYDKDRYVQAAEEWLQYVKSVGDSTHHTLTLHIKITDSIQPDGEAIIDEYADINGAAFPVTATMWIHSRTHADAFDPTDYQTTLRHELAHVFGIGILTVSYTEAHTLMQGPAYCLQESQAVRWYNHLYDNNYPCLPLSLSGDHFYDHYLIEDPIRYDLHGNAIPPLTPEVAANGEKIGIITIALLEDLGYGVEYPEVSFLE
ncbi:hypothetical protein Q8W40_14095 [Vibrio penaeicida]|uniref:hypothetical protein n=1 Tax=Vibrio penaeicida TaxID=104609 RepID=UPI0027325A19|nr:hypothetical protein [Vibrio penaeicida]MDP2573319.1 hypothetical protein [Vibrio penaeicida]